MTERYDSIAAAHYAAYRPPLHETILLRVLPAGAQYKVGVDIGCGTGYSAVALASYCDRVYAVDPSEAMLGHAIADDRISYRIGEGASIPLPDASADIITFAGSLFYSDSPDTRSEIVRVGRIGCLVVAYDFDILLRPILATAGIRLSADASAYNHTANLSGAAGLVEQCVETDEVNLRMSAEQLAHVVLSDSNRCDELAAHSGTADPWRPLTDALARVGPTLSISARVYYSVYSKGV
ncbi:MAG: class I SAM-dependent methyltransferase [Rhodothermales bacterium]